MRPSNPSAGLLIFDWDGTLVDSVAFIAESMRTAASAEGLPVPSVDAARNIVGLGLNEAIKTLYPQICKAQSVALRASFSDIFRCQKNYPCELFDGVRRYLRCWHEAGFTLAVATGKSRAGLQREMQQQQLGEHFDASRCSDETRSKPHPMMLQQLLDELSFVPKRALMIGDTQYDLDMATNAGITSIAVDYGAHTRSRLLEAHPMACVSRFKDLNNHIKEYFEINT